VSYIQTFVRNLINSEDWSCTDCDLLDYDKVSSYGWLSTQYRQCKIESVPVAMCAVSIDSLPLWILQIYFIFRWPCIVTSFVQNNQLASSNIQHLFCHKTLHVSGIFCLHHQELSTVHSAIGTFHAGYVSASKQSQVGTQFQPDSAWKRTHNLHETYQLPSVQ